MKHGSELFAQPLDFEHAPLVTRRMLAAVTLFLHRCSRRIPSRRQVVLAAVASLWIATVFLFGSYLFLHQLAEHGW